MKTKLPDYKITNIIFTKEDVIRLQFTYSTDDGMVFWSDIPLTKDEKSGILAIVNTTIERVKSKIREEIA